MRITESYNKYTEEKNVIIYGAGRYGELAYWGLKSIGESPSFFADRTLVGQDYFGIKVISPEEIVNYKEYAVLLASLNNYYEMLSYLQSIGHEKIYDILDLIKLDYDDSVLTEYCKDEKHNWTKYKNVIDNADAGKLIINHCEVVITECCTLKCRDCANLMQYYEHPEIFDIEEIIENFDRFLNCIDLLLDMRILGGEPFIHKGIGRLLKHYSVCDKIKRITIYTNSTILPNQDVIDSMKSDKITVHMSDYGRVSNMVSELDKVLTQNGIDHYIHKYDRWHDLGGTEKRHHSQTKLKELYKNCIMSKCLSFYRGRLYTCPRAGHGEQLGLFKIADNEYVDFSYKNEADRIREKIRYIVEFLEYITPCDYCNGSNSRSKQIDAAIQKE